MIAKTYMVKDLFKGKAATLKDLGCSVEKFSNVTLGNDEIEYALIGAKKINRSGILDLSVSKSMIRHRGSQKGAQKYSIKKGDIVFSDSKKFKYIGVATSDPEIPAVGNHSLMRISCGGNLDLAFALKDYLQYIGKNSELFENGVTVKALETLEFFFDANMTFDGYMEISIKVKKWNEQARELAKKLDILENDLFVHTLRNGSAENEIPKEYIEKIDLHFNQISSAIGEIQK